MIGINNLSRLIIQLNQILNMVLKFQLQSPSGGSRPSSVSSGGNGSTCSSSKAKVPQNFGYVKRQNGMQQAPQSNGAPQHGQQGHSKIIEYI